MKNYKEIDRVCFPVKKVESLSLMSDNDTLFNSENSFAIVGQVNRNGKTHQKVLNFCSGQYKLLENKNALVPLMGVLEKKMAGLDVHSRMKNECQFHVEIFPVLPTTSPRTEVIKPAVVFGNSYDGKIRANAVGGLVRYLVDEEGKVSRTVTAYIPKLSFQYDFKHNDSAIIEIEVIDQKVDYYLKNFEKVENLIEGMKSVEIEDHSRKNIEEIVRALTEDTKFPKSVISGMDDKGKAIPEMIGVENVVERIIYERLVYQTKLNYWIVYSAMNYILHNTAESSLSAKERKDIDNQIFANIIEMVPQTAPEALLSSKE